MSQYEVVLPFLLGSNLRQREGKQLTGEWLLEAPIHTRHLSFLDFVPQSQSRIGNSSKTRPSGLLSGFQSSLPEEGLAL